MSAAEETTVTSPAIDAHRERHPDPVEGCLSCLMCDVLNAVLVVREEIRTGLADLAARVIGTETEGEAP
jgi:hypothetical protein